MQQFRVGIIGCGEVTQTMHLPALYQLADRFTVTAICDVSQQVLTAVGDRWQVAHRFLDYQTLLQQPDIDVVLIANPHAYHAETICAALDAGKHILVEKPMCLNCREADAIIEAQRTSGRIVQVGQMRRYAPAFIQACDLIRRMQRITLARVHDVIGKNALFTTTTSRVIRGTDVPEDVVAATTTLQDRLVQEAIGEVAPAVKTAYLIMLGLSTHDISAMRELLGMPQRVLYAAQRQGGLYLSAAIDYGDYICHFETGIDNIARFDACLEVYSPDQVVRVTYNTPYIRNLPIRLSVISAHEQGIREQTDHPGWNDPFTLEWEAFYDNIVNRREPKTSPADFRHDLELFGEMIKLMT